jgi:hypothetical protein
MTDAQRRAKNAVPEDDFICFAPKKASLSHGVPVRVFRE